MRTFKGRFISLSLRSGKRGGRGRAVGRGQEGEEEMARREKTWQKSKKRGQVAWLFGIGLSAPEGIAVSNLPACVSLNYLKLRGVSLAAIAGFHGFKF